MQKFSDIVLLVNVPGGQARVPASAFVQINLSGGGGLATIYSDNGVTQRANPIHVDGSGQYYFYAADGVYDRTTSGPGMITETETEVIQLRDFTSGATSIGANHTKVIATGGQTAIPLPFGYVQGINAIGVYVNGLRMIVGVDYTETSTTVVTFTAPLLAGDEVDLYGGLEVASGFPSANVSFVQSGSGAIADNLQSKNQQIVNVMDFMTVAQRADVRASGALDVSAAIQAAIDSIDNSGGKGGTVEGSNGVYNIGTTTITGRSRVRVKFAGRRSCLVNYSGTGAAFEDDSVAESGGLEGCRIGIGSSASAIGLNLKTTTSSMLGRQYKDIQIAGDTVAGQKGLQAVASGGNIISENLFSSINITNIDKPLIRTDTEGNTWTDIVIDNYGSGASPVGINDVGVHAENTQARVAGVRAGVTTPIAHNIDSGCNYSTTQLSADIGATGKAINSAGSLNIWLVNRAGNFTPIGTYQDSETVIDTHLLAVGGGQIKFPATQVPSSNVNTLDDYAEGTWTPIDASGAALTFTTPSGSYVKVGQQVHAYFDLTYPVTADGSTAIVGGLPFTSAGTASSGSVNFSLLQYATPITGIADASATTFRFFTLAAGAVTNANLSGTIVRGVAIYRATA